MRPMDVVVLLLVAGALLFVYGRRAVARVGLRRRLRTARKKEDAAASFLRERGYSIVDVGCRVPITTRVDDRAYDAEVRADLLARRGGRLYVAEILGGDRPVRITQRQTCRRLLEYFVAYRPDGILMVDMDRQRVRKVEFRVRDRGMRRIARVLRWVAAAGAGAGLMYLWGRMAGWD